MVEKQELKKELQFCIALWEEKGFCTFGNKTECEKCAVPYLLWKLISGEVIHGENIKRLSLEDWKTKLKNLK